MADELPLQMLSWQDFERLCLQLARRESDVVSARLYGEPGQEQSGIDFYARLAASEQYRVYQCKRVKNFEPNVIRDAVKRFLSDEWAKRSAELVICTSDRLRTTQRIEELETQRKQLSELGFGLDVWAREDICERLRRAPELVFDFFGRSWVELFCGLSIDATFARRIGPAQVAAFRRRLFSLYGNVFLSHDPGLITSNEDHPLSIAERYVVPDVFELRDSSAEEDPSVRPYEFHSSDPSHDELRAGAWPSRRVGYQYRRMPTVSSERRRVPVDHHFAGAPDARRVLIGGPGTGKSALLRFVALDLLSPEPRLGGLARTWGRHLPVWVPFGAWVDRIARGGTDVSLRDVLREWLAQWGEESLYPLIDAVLEDQRLLLLVDGLDEWSSEDAARIALAQLHVFAKQQECPVIVTSRPHGFERLASEFGGWTVADLAPLSHAQQVALARQWYDRRIVTGQKSSETARTGSDAPNGTVDFQRSSRLAHDAIAEIHEIEELRSLAEVPLLLSALLLLKLRDAELPRDRFRAYEELTHQLITVQPRRRRAAALQTGGPAAGVRDEERRQSYAYLAFRVVLESPTGLIEERVARQHLELVLQNEDFGLGYSPDDARRLSRELIDVGEEVSGILVKRSQRDLGFYHRALQDYLAAVHLSSLPERDQLAAVAINATNPQWRDVILSLGSLMRSQELVGRLVDAIRASAHESPGLDDTHVAELLTEIATGSFLCPLAAARQILDEASAIVETGWWLEHRRRVLGMMLSGLRNRRTIRLIVPRLRAWFPERVWYRPSLFATTRQWELDEAWPVLRSALYNADDEFNRIAAAEELAEHFAGE
ncbi:MAG TPA: NACHT domain-containing protein, partial [Gemmatimonadaceae bacterium]